MRENFPFLTKTTLLKRYQPIAIAVKNLEQFCHIYGYDVKIEWLSYKKLGDVGEIFSLRITLSNPKNGGKITIRDETHFPTSRETKIDEIFVKKINSIIGGLYEKPFSEEDEKIATRLLLGFMDAKFTANFFSDLEIIRVAKIALETGLKMKFLSEMGFEDIYTYKIKNPRKSIGNFLKKYLQAYGKLPIEEIDMLVNNAEAYAKRCSFHSKLYRLLPPELAALYSVRSLRDPTVRDINIMRRMLFGKDQKTREKAILAIIFHLRFKKDHRLDELFAEYVRERADRAEALSYLCIILSWELDRDMNSKVLLENYPRSIKELVKKVLNVDEPISLKIVDEDYSPKIILDMGGGVQIALKETAGMSIEVGSTNPLLKKCKTVFTIDFYDPKDLKDYLWVIDEYISLSTRYLEEVEKAGMRMLSKLPPAVIKLYQIASETVEVLPAHTPELNVTAPDVKGEELRELLERFDYDSRVCLDSLSLKLGNRLLSKNALDKYAGPPQERSKRKREVYGV